LKRALANVLLAVSLVTGCEEAPRYASWSVPRAAHPPWQPAASSASSTRDEPFRARAPEVIQAPSPALPAAVETTFANGVQVITMKRTGLPVVAVRVAVARGAAQANTGLAAFVAAMLFEGTSHREGLVVHQVLMEIGATFSASAAYDAVAIDAKVPSWNLLPALTLLVDVLRDASFPADKVERVRARRLEKIDQNASTPAAIASEQLGELLYDAAHPCHFTVDGDAAATRRVRREELLTFWRSAAVPPLTGFLIAGDFDRGEVESKLHELVDDWSGAAPASKDLPEGMALTGAPVVLVDHAGDPQSVVRIGWRVPGRNSPDIAPLRALAESLARGTTGRLNRVLRHQRGETYGVDSSVTGRADSGEFVISAAIERDRTADALREILSEVERARTGPFDAGEVHARMEARLWQSFETSSDAVAVLTATAVYREPIERFFARWRGSNEVQPEELVRAATRYLTPQSRALVIVGDASSVRPSLGSVGLGNIVVRPSPGLAGAMP
jgi:zinc protease